MPLLPSHCCCERIKASARCFHAAVKHGGLKNEHSHYWLIHLDLVLQRHHASFSSDAFLQQLLQPNPPSLRRTSACGLELFGPHPKCQEVVEPLVTAAGRSVLARGPLPLAVAVGACFQKRSVKAKLGANCCILASGEALQGHLILEQAVQHCYHQVKRSSGHSESDFLNQNVYLWPSLQQC